MNMAKYIIRDREAGNIIEQVSTRKEAETVLKKFEEEDKQDGNYTEDFYEIVEESPEISEIVRNMTDMNRSAFAKKYGIPYRTIDDWDAGRRNPSDWVMNLLGKVVTMSKYGKEIFYRVTTIGPHDEWVEPATDNIVTAVKEARNLVANNNKYKEQKNWKVEIRIYLDGDPYDEDIDNPVYDIVEF